MREAAVKSIDRLKRWSQVYATVTQQKLECGAVRTLTHHPPTTIFVPGRLSFPLSASGTVAPEEQLGIVDGLGDHVAISKET